jgi:REP element-mobilizing transposase RayT
MGRFSEPGRPYLITTVTRDRWPLLGDWLAGRACARVLHEAPADTPVSPLAWVIMPDHVHWLFVLEAGSLSAAVRRFKSRSARAVNDAAGRSGPLWQAGYHDRAVRREEDLRALARYVIANPLRAGLCRHVCEYPFWDAIWLDGSGDADIA